MKKIAALSITSILLISGLSATTIAETDECDDCEITTFSDGYYNCCSKIELPPNFITMVVEQGTVSFWDVILSNLPDGYDVTNDDYLGWCIQGSVPIRTGILHTVKLYCSYDHSKPDIWDDEDWDKINYIVNHKRGGRMDVQEAIWYFINDRPTKNLMSISMIIEAKIRGNGFCPDPGEVMVVILDSGRDINPIVQGIIIEFPIPLEIELSG